MCAQSCLILIWNMPRPAKEGWIDVNQLCQASDIMFFVLRTNGMRSASNFEEISLPADERDEVTLPLLKALLRPDRPSGLV